ncbi:MAG: DNA polymerase IV [Alphaproteobacteria bacterium]
MKNSPKLCLSCLTERVKDGRCKTCGSTRTVSHPELNKLSIAHLDCDAFYASVEKRENPKLMDKPVIIGGGRRGVVATCCYVARTYGVRSAMPMFKAKKLCPNAVVIRPRMELYSAEGKRLRAMMKDLTPLVEPLSIDEAFMDLSGTEKLHHQPPSKTLAMLAHNIEREVGITVSIGLSYNKFLAKVASELDKPRGFSIIGEKEARKFLKNKPVSIIYGVGQVLNKTLKRDGVLKMGDLQKREEADLIKRYGAMGSRLYNFSWGQDKRKVNPVSEVKSISNETTLDIDIADIDQLLRVLWPLCEKVSDRLKARGLAGRTVVLKAKTTRFRTLTRNRTLSTPTQHAETIFEVGQEMLRGLTKGEAFRLIGIGVADFTRGDTAQPEMELIGGTDKRKLMAEEALDKIKGKFGRDAIKKGRSLK